MGTICDRANGDSKGMDTKQTFCLIFSYLRAHHKGLCRCSFPSSFPHREFQSCSGKGISELRDVLLHVRSCPSRSSCR